MQKTCKKISSSAFISASSPLSRTASDVRHLQVQYDSEVTQRTVATAYDLSIIIDWATLCGAPLGCRRLHARTSVGLRRKQPRTVRTRKSEKLFLHRGFLVEEIGGFSPNSYSKLRHGCTSLTKVFRELRKWINAAHGHDKFFRCATWRASARSEPRGLDFNK